MSKERENFYRISTIIVENGRECLANLLEVDLSNKKLLFREFIDLNKHYIHHLHYNKYPCCQCTGGRLPPDTSVSRILNTEQFSIIFDNTNRIPGHIENKRFKECCFPVKQNVKLDDFDITLTNCMLMNFATNCQRGSYVRQAVDALIKLRNEVYGHAMKASLTDAEFLIHQSALKVVILTISRACGKEDEMGDKLVNVYRRPLDKAMCMQYQNLLLKEIRQQQENEEANRGYFDAVRDAIYSTGAWIVSKITGSNQLSSTTVQDGILNNSDTSVGGDGNINIKTELQHKVTKAVNTAFEEIIFPNNRTTQHDANDMMQPGNTIPPNDNDSTNGDCVLLESEIDKLKREKGELERKNEEMKTKIDNLERKRKAQTDESDDNDAGQVRPKRVQRTPNTK